MTAEAWPRPFDHAAWRKDAACIGLTDLFFPERGQNATKALKVCAGCPVKTQCGELADANYERHGVWGGEVVSEKARGRRMPMIRSSAHGTDSGYWAHRRRSEPPCDPCRVAHNQRKVNYDHERRQAS